MKRALLTLSGILVARAGFALGFLPPEKEAQLRKLLADRRSVQHDAQAAIEKMGYVQGSSESYVAFAKASHGAEQEIDAEIQSLFGKTGVADLQEAQRQTQSMVQLQASLRTKLTWRAMPLSMAQLKAVAETLGPLGNQSVFLEPGLPPEQEQALLNRVAAVLTPEQFQVFEEDRALQKEMKELPQRGMEAAKKALDHDIKSWSARGP